LKTIELYGGKLLCDIEATRRAYEGHESYAVTCTCIPCKNYLAVREKYFPQQTSEVLQSFGIQYKKDIEVYHMGKVEGLHLYGLWFYFVGEILKEPVYQNSVAFIAGGKWLPPSFVNKRLVSIDIELRLPWEIALEEPVS